MPKRKTKRKPRARRAENYISKDQLNAKFELELYSGDNNEMVNYTVEYFRIAAGVIRFKRFGNEWVEVVPLSELNLIRFKRIGGAGNETEQEL